MYFRDFKIRFICLETIFFPTEKVTGSCHSLLWEKKKWKSTPNTPLKYEKVSDGVGGLIYFICSIVFIMSNVKT